MLNIKVVGSGCPTCQKLEQLCREVITENNIEAEIEKITDVNSFAGLGVFITPGLLLNNQLISSGKLPAKASIEEWVKDVI